MAEVIDFSNRKKIKEDLNHADRLESLRTLVRCQQCAMSCGKCGGKGETAHLVSRPGSNATFRLCPGCLEEYLDLVSYLESGSDSGNPSWYNREWVRQWLAWLDYQLALVNYSNSPEVLQILQETKPD